MTCNEDVQPDHTENKRDCFFYLNNIAVNDAVLFDDILESDKRNRFFLSLKGCQQV